MIRKLFFLFIFFAPFTSFFALSSWMRLPVIINQILFLFIILGVLITGRIKNKWIETEDMLLIGILILVWLSFLLGFKEQRSFNHALAYTNSIIFYFFASKYVINLLNIKAIQISKVIYRSFVFCSLIIIIDFIAINYYDFSLRRIFSPVVDYKISNMDYFIRHGFLRVGGVAEEPGHMANFYNIYFGISLFYLHKKNQLKTYKWLFLIFVLSHFALYSNAGIALALLAFLLIFVINRVEKFSLSKKQIIWFLGILVAAVFSIIVGLVFKLKINLSEINYFIKKISFSQESGKYSSGGARLDQWSRALNNFLKHPIFGNGPGYGVNEDAEGYLSVYFTILSDVGLFAFLFFILFQALLLMKIFKLKGFSRDFILFSAITSFLHLFIIADFYQAPVWILFFVIQLIYKENKFKVL